MHNRGVSGPNVHCRVAAAPNSSRPCTCLLLTWTVLPKCRRKFLLVPVIVVHASRAFWGSISFQANLNCPKGFLQACTERTSSIISHVSTPEELFPKMEQLASPTDPTSGHTQLYFAYGSNLSIKQMATRCPESQYIGLAILPDYIWHINERGYANIAPCAGATVHGLVYKLSDDDESRLDRREGVEFGCYQKKNVTVTLHEAPPSLQGRTVEMAVNNIARFLPQQEQQARAQSEVLVYLSDHYKGCGKAHYEYIVRMNSEIRDAVALGVPVGYIDEMMRPSIPDREF